MSRRRIVCTALSIWFSLLSLLTPSTAHGDITAEDVHSSIDKGVRFLLRKQDADGGWSNGNGWDVGLSSLTVLALLNSKVPTDNPQIERALRHLRSQDPNRTYEISLLIMALAAARDQRDSLKIRDLVQKLEDSQIRRGPGLGGWSYGRGGMNMESGDHSNSQYAVLALRDAQEYGVEVSAGTWDRIRRQWQNSQNEDGGWGYVPTGSPSTGSMTVAGIASMVIVKSMLNDDANEVDAEGNPICCGGDEEDDPVEQAINRGVDWLSKRFTIGKNPHNGNWQLYYLYPSAPRTVSQNPCMGHDRVDRVGVRRRHRRLVGLAEYLLGRRGE